MAFNFGSLANVKPASTTSYLKAYTINENVTIKSSEITSGTSATTERFVKDTSNKIEIYTKSCIKMSKIQPDSHGRYKITTKYCKDKMFTIVKKSVENVKKSPF